MVSDLHLVRKLGGMKRLDVGNAGCDGPLYVGADSIAGSGNLLLRNLESIDMAAVEFQRIVAQGGVAFGADALNDGIDSFGHSGGIGDVAAHERNPLLPRGIYYGFH